MSFEKISESYKKKGYSRKNKRKTKLAEYAIFLKTEEGFLWDTTSGEFVYHIDGDVTLAHTNDFLKRYQKIYEDMNFGESDKGILSYTGNLNTSEFRKIARNLLDEEQYKNMKLKKEKTSTKTTTQKPITKKTRSKRPKLAKAQQTLILKSQDYKCALCKCDISKITPDFDHRIPLALRGSNALTNIQALCPNCHREKTAKDSLEIARSKR